MLGCSFASEFLAGFSFAGTEATDGGVGVFCSVAIAGGSTPAAAMTASTLHPAAIRCRARRLANNTERPVNLEFEVGNTLSLVAHRLIGPVMSRDGPLTAGGPLRKVNSVAAHRRQTTEQLLACWRLLLVDCTWIVQHAALGLQLRTVRDDWCAFLRAVQDVSLGRCKFFWCWLCDVVAEEPV